MYHAMVMTAAKLVVNVDAEAGNRIASAYALPTLWGWLDAHEEDAHEEKDWPTLVRGDIAYGNEERMTGCEPRGLAYLFQLRQSQRVAQLLGKLARQGGREARRDGVTRARAGRGSNRSCSYRAGKRRAE